jgi:hypothetical protein
VTPVLYKFSGSFTRRSACLFGSSSLKASILVWSEICVNHQRVKVKLKMTVNRLLTAIRRVESILNTCTTGFSLTFCSLTQNTRIHNVLTLLNVLIKKGHCVPDSLLKVSGNHFFRERPCQELFPSSSQLKMNAESTYDLDWYFDIWQRFCSTTWE